MEIKDLQIDDDLGFPELGRIRLGVREPNDSGKLITRETPHFVLRDAPALIPHYGTEPTELLVYLPFRKRSNNYSTQYEYYVGRKDGQGKGNLYCQGDGKNITWAVDPGRSGEVVIRNGYCILPYQESDGTQYSRGAMVPCSGKSEERLYPRCQKCKANARLSILVRDPQAPHMLAGGNQLGYYLITTHSKRNITEITQGLNTVELLAGLMSNKNGLAFIPMVLRRKSGDVSITIKDGDTGNGRRARTQKHFLELEVDKNWLNQAMQSVNPALSATATDIPALPSGGEQDYIDAPEVVAFDPLVSDRVADIEAMRDTPILDIDQIKAFLTDTLGSSLDIRSFFLDVRARMGINRMVALKPSEAWPHIIDEVIGILTRYEV